MRGRAPLAPSRAPTAGPVGVPSSRGQAISPSASATSPSTLRPPPPSMQATAAMSSRAPTAPAVGAGERRRDGSSAPSPWTPTRPPTYMRVPEMIFQQQQEGSSGARTTSTAGAGTRRRGSPGSSSMSPPSSSTPSPNHPLRGHVDHLLRSSRRGRLQEHRRRDELERHGTEQSPGRYWFYQWPGHRPPDPDHPLCDQWQLRR